MLVAQTIPKLDVADSNPVGRSNQSAASTRGYGKASRGPSRFSGVVLTRHRIRMSRPVRPPGFRTNGLEYAGLTVDNLDGSVTELRTEGAEIAVGPMMRSAGLYLVRA